MSIEVGSTMYVKVHTWSGDDVKVIHPAVPCRVAYIGRKQHPNDFGISVVLLSDSGPGWYAGDTYRAQLGELSPNPP